LLGCATSLYQDVTMTTSIWEIALGQWLAMCAHPVCAWRARSMRVRLLVVMSYFGAGYVGVLALLTL
jgi:hypothetical protein